MKKEPNQLPEATAGLVTGHGFTVVVGQSIP